MTVLCPPACRPCEVETWRLIMLTPTSHITYQKNDLITLSLNHYYNASHYLLQVGTHSFSRQESTVSPFAWKSNKAGLFYFTQSSVSEIWFVTGVQRSWGFGIGFGPQHGTNTGMDPRGVSLGLFRSSEDFSSTASFERAKDWRIPLEIGSPGILAGKAEPQL